MEEYGKKAIELIEKQQKGIEHTAPWMVGEQLKEICRREPKAAELLYQDLQNPDLSLAEAEKKIKAWADKHKTGNFACVPPNQAEQILRTFYGIPEPGESAQHEGAGGVCVNLMDFLG